MKSILKVQEAEKVNGTKKQKRPMQTLLEHR